MSGLATATRIENAILLIRGQKVLLDADLAALYGVETKALVKAVKRNAEGFPADFMFRLLPEEVARLWFQIGTTKRDRGRRRYAPYGADDPPSSIPSTTQCIQSFRLDFSLPSGIGWHQHFQHSKTGGSDAASSRGPS